MLTLSGIAGHQRRSWEIFNFTEDGRWFPFISQLPSENKTETRSETLPMEKKIHIKAEEEEARGMKCCFFGII